MAWIDVPATAKTARFTAFSDVGTFGDFVLYGESKIVGAVTKLVANDVVQDAAIAANIAAIADLTKTMTKLVDVTLTETAAINITQDDDGNALNIKDRAIVVLLFPQGSSVEQPNFNLFYRNGNTIVGTIYANASVSTLAGNKPGCIGWISNFGGVWRGEYSQTNANVGGITGNVISNGDNYFFPVATNPINKITTGTSVLAGTRIQVWGC